MWEGKPDICINEYIGLRMIVHYHTMRANMWRCCCLFAFIWYSFNRFNPDACLCLSKSRTSISCSLYHGRFCAQLSEVWYGSIGWYWWNCWPSCNKDWIYILYQVIWCWKQHSEPLINPLVGVYIMRWDENVYYQCKMNTGNRKRNKNGNENTI